jgi:hypothetical protein
MSPLKVFGNAWQLLTRRKGFWFLVGFFSLAIELAVGFGISFAASTILATDPINLGGNGWKLIELLVGAFFTYLGFVTAAAMVKMALAQVRTGDPMAGFRMRDLPYGALVPMSLASFATSRLIVEQLERVANSYGMPFMYMGIMLLLTVPVIVAIPLVVERRATALAAGPLSLRLVAPVFLNILAVFLLFYLTPLPVLILLGFSFACFPTVLITLPMACILFCFLWPLYYLLVAEIYENRLRVLQTNGASESAG